MGHAMAQLVEAVRYKPNLWVRFPSMSLDFLFDIILPDASGPGVNSASDRNEYEEYFLGGNGGRA
jgi:hypothetical protein